MAIRATQGLVEEILGDNYRRRKQPNLAPYIEQANRLTNRLKTAAAAKGDPVDEPTLKDIEVNLAAYFYTMTDPLATSKHTGDASASYKRDSYLDVAKMLDPSGTLAALLSPKRASIGWLGKVPSEQTPFWQRD